MSNTPGISPITIDIEEIRHSEEESVETIEKPQDGDADDETEDVRIERVKRETIDLA